MADELARAERLDEELRWMLSYYYLVEPRYVDRFDGLDHLKQAGREEALLYRQACLNRSFRGRGHMGRYCKTKQTILRQWP